MFDTIMELPLFKGIGQEQLSNLLEKTRMEFLKFEDGDSIIKSGGKVETLDFILSGRVRLTYPLENFPIAIDEIIGKGAVLGAFNLFGMVTHYPASATAIGRVSIMRMEKSQYMNILQTDRIYILNFVNLLSAAAQKAPELFIHIKDTFITKTLKSLAYAIVSRAAETVIVAGSDEDLAAYCGVDADTFSEWKINELSHHRIISNQRGIFLKSPHLLR